MNQSRITKMSQIFVWKTLYKEITLIAVTIPSIESTKILHRRDNENNRNNC